MTFAYTGKGKASLNESCRLGIGASIEVQDEHSGLKFSYFSNFYTTGIK